MKKKQNKTGKNLVIVESPTKTKSLSKFLGKKFIIEASVGHVKDLPQKKLGVDVEKNFTPQYVTIKGKEKVLATLKKAAKKAKQVYLAPDPDREGEAIAFHVAKKKKNLLAGLFKIEEKGFEIRNESEVKKLTEDIKTKKFVVSEVKTETKNR